MKSERVPFTMEEVYEIVRGIFHNEDALATTNNCSPMIVGAKSGRLMISESIISSEGVYSRSRNYNNKKINSKINTVPIIR